jgi:predicted MPP superfamily phosphohydrolase
MQSTKAFIIFLAIAISIYALINTYVYLRGFSALSGDGRWVISLKILFVAVVLAFPVSIFFRNTSYCQACNVLTIIGSFWVGAMLYFFLLAFLSEIVILIQSFVPLIPAKLKADRILFGRAVFFGSIVLVALILIMGWVNTLFIRVKPLEVALAQLDKANNPTTIVYVSDVHLGLIIHEKRLDAFVEKINAQHPDVIIFGGDLVDESVEGLDHMPEILAGLKAPRGVYAVLGNHEFYAGHEKAEAFMKSAGIRVLRDEVVTLPGLVNLVGLDDPTALRFGKKKEASVPELMKRSDPKLPTILLFHPPIRMKEYSAYGIDLMLSGHSHHGQLFPANLITRMVYLVDYGYRRVGPMQVYVSCGLGTWGPPVRVLTHPEIVKITLVSGEGLNQ